MEPSRRLKKPGSLMPTPDKLTIVVEDIRAAAIAVGALVVPALPGGRELPKSVMVGQKDLLSLIQHLNPKIVYLDQIIFKAVEYLSDTIDAEDDELVDHPAVKVEARRLKRYEGLIQYVMAIVVYDGIDHALLEEAVWLDEAKAAVDRVQAKLELEGKAEIERHNLAVEEQERNRREREEADRRSLIRDKAVVLRADTRFETGKVTKAKRRHLAKSLFPDLPNATLSKIVDEAEGSLWLEASDG